MYGQASGSTPPTIAATGAKATIATRSATAVAASGSRARARRTFQRAWTKAAARASRNAVSGTPLADRSAHGVVLSLDDARDEAAPARAHVYHLEGKLSPEVDRDRENHPDDDRPLDSGCERQREREGRGRHAELQARVPEQPQHRCHPNQGDDCGDDDGGEHRARQRRDDPGEREE